MRYLSGILIIISLLLGGCASEDMRREKLRTRTPSSARERKEEKIGTSILDDPLFTTAPKNKNETAGIGVNTYLWKASLEACSFMPKKTVNPFAGIISTKWYTPPETPRERLRLEIIITGRDLRSDGLKVSIFRQQRNTKNEWVNQEVDPNTINKVEETILSRSRSLKIAEEK